MELKYILIILAIVFLLLVLLGLSIVNYSMDEMWEQFKKASQFSVGVTPLEFAKHINNVFFNNFIRIKFKDGYFCDSFNGSGILTLSNNYANKYELAGLAICAHELGHALQFKEKPKMMLSHAKRIKLSKAISWLVTPLLITAVVMLILSQIVFAMVFALLAVLGFMVAVITKWTTLRIEKDASERAFELLEVYAGLYGEQLQQAKKVLNSAKQTYLAEVLRIMLKWTFLVKKR